MKGVIRNQFGTSSKEVGSGSCSEFSWQIVEIDIGEMDIARNNGSMFVLVIFLYTDCLPISVYYMCDDLTDVTVRILG
jgi:hypothetical protein